MDDHWHTLHLKLPSPYEDREYRVVRLSDEDTQGAEEGSSRNLNQGFARLRPTPLSIAHSLSASSTGSYAPAYTGDTLYAKSPAYYDDELKGARTPSTAVDPFAVPFLPKSSPTDSPGKRAAPPRRPVTRTAVRGAAGHFERPEWVKLGVYIFLCACAYPFLVLVSLAASHKSLFWARCIVGIGTSVLGFCLAYNLYELARRYLEASTWATVIHESSGAGGNGVPLRLLARHTSEPLSVYTAVELFFERMQKQSTTRKARGSYDNRPWSLFIVFFLLLLSFASSLPFIFSRIVIIDAATVQQQNVFDEVPVWGDLSPHDVAAAANLADVFSKFVQTWTLAPFASLTDLPSSISFDFENDTVYFADSYASQLRSDGSALGVFNLDLTTANARETKASWLVNNTNMDTGGLVQFPKWGIRISCGTLPEPSKYLVPTSTDGYTYVFVPNSFLEQLAVNLSLPFPLPDLRPVNYTRLLSVNDTVPAGIDPSTIGVGGQFYNNGVAHSFFSKPADLGASGGGWVEVEILLVRLNTTFTPHGIFPVFGAPVPDIAGAETRIGYDAAVCIEAYEPWIVETYNATGVVPASTRIVRKGGTIFDEDLSEFGARRRGKLHGTDEDVPRTINSTGKIGAFAVAHDNSINQMVKDNGRDIWYVPSPLIVSFTDGSGPSGYTRLSSSHYAEARATADATNTLPFLAGSGALVARFYPSRVIAMARVDKIPMIVATLLVTFIGVAAGLCVPRLPLAVPRRGFDLLSWLAVLHGDNMIGQLPILPGGRAGLDEKMAVEDIERRFGDIRVRYTA